MLHLDTSTVVAFLRGDEGVAKSFLQHQDQLAISTVVLAELFYGAQISSRPEVNLTRVQAFRSTIQLVAFDERAAMCYSEIRFSLRKRGLPTGEVDALIAAIAMAHGSRLITHNAKHFQNIEGLQLEDWVRD